MKTEYHLIIFLALITLGHSVNFEHYEEINVDSDLFCESAKDSWKCCVTVEQFSSTACVGVELLRKDIGVRATITYNNETVYQNEISVRNPPLICAKIPYTKDILEACIKFYDMEIDKPHKQVTGCARFYIVLFSHKYVKISLGCFDFPIPAKEIKLLEKKNGLRGNDKNIAIKIIP